ncbi:MAG: N-formylglutamate amidohydrolase [candidate division KSB1 bacterium]|jgi:formiminoglutamase|nr:N-formylglutamate amidohydrolase [candidate division KSB1 bacterium]
MINLPFLISIPHGGTEVPPEILDDVCIAPQDLFDDSDAFTQEIFNVEDIVVCQVVTPIARAFVDVSRSMDKKPPEFSDGLIKSATCYNKPIYKTGRQPGKKLVNLLIEEYYKPYHEELNKQIQNKRIVIGLDCHSMAEDAPEISPDKGQKRPLMNLGDAEGMACSPVFTKLLRKRFLDVFGFPESEVTINNPFKGGYITRKFGNNPKPWIQIELNRKLYLDDKYFKKEKLTMKSNRLQELNEKFRDVLFLFSRDIK